MRLAVFTNEFPSRLTTFFARDLSALLAAGIEIDVFPLYPLDASLWSWVPDSLSPEVLPRERIHHLTLHDAVAMAPRGGWPRVARFGRDALRVGAAAARHGPGPVAKTGYTALLAWAWAQRWPAERYDHVLAYWGNYSATAALIYHRLGGARIPFSMFVHARMDLYQRRIYLAQKLLHADNVFLVCEYNRGYLRDRYPRVFPRIASKVAIHHLGLDLDEVPFDPSPRPPHTLLAVGRLEGLKGYRQLLLAVRAVRDRGVPVALELIGGGEQEAELRDLARRLDLGAAVRFRGWQPSPVVLDAMRRATVFVHAPSAPDAMPTVLKEAMAVGTPTIGSRLAGIPEILDGGGCGLLVPPGDVGALADAIESLLRDGALRDRLAAAGRRRVEAMFDARRNGRLLADRLRATRRTAPAAPAAPAALAATAGA